MNNKKNNKKTQVCHFPPQEGIQESEIEFHTKKEKYLPPWCEFSHWMFVHKQKLFHCNH